MNGKVSRTNHGEGDCLSLGHAPRVRNQRRQLSPNIGPNNRLTALRTDAGGNGFNYDELL